MMIILIPFSLFFLINSIIVFLKKQFPQASIYLLLSVVFALVYYNYSQSFSIRLLEAEISELRSENLKLNSKR
jgi:hypothetical protein